MKIKRILFPEFDTIHVEEVEMDVDHPEPDELIVRNLFSFVSAGTELACLKGQEPDWFRFPQSPGYVATGEVVAKGSAVEGFEVGDHVQGMGQHMAYFRQKASRLTHWDKDIDLKDVLFAAMASISLGGLRVSEIELGDYVGVLGLGVVGNLAAQLAQLQGGYVLAMDLEPARVEKGVECGLRHVVVASRSSNRSHVDAFTDGLGLHCLIEATGNPRALLSNLDLVMKLGEVILLGSPRDECVVNVTELLQSIHLSRRGCLRLKGACGCPPARQKERPGGGIRLALRLIQEGRLCVKPLLTHLAKPDEAERIYRGLQDQPGEYLGVIFNWA